MLTDLGYTVTDEDTELFWTYDYVAQLIQDDRVPDTAGGKSTNPRIPW